MHQLDDRAQPDHAGAGIAQRAGSKQEKRRADALAAAAAQILGDLGDGVDGRDGVAAEFELDGHQVIAEQIEDFPCRCYRECAQCARVPCSFPFVSDYYLMPWMAPCFYRTCYGAILSSES